MMCSEELIIKLEDMCLLGKRARLGVQSHSTAHPYYKTKNFRTHFFGNLRMQHLNHESTRCLLQPERKQIIEVENKPMIQWVFERSKSAESIEEVIVATDDERILKAVKGFGGKVVLTSSKHVSGTDRIAEVAKDLDYDFIEFFTERKYNKYNPIWSKKGIKGRLKPGYMKKTTHLLRLLRRRDLERIFHVPQRIPIRH